MIAIGQLEEGGRKRMNRNITHEAQVRISTSLSVISYQFETASLFSNYRYFSIFSIISWGTLIH